jgi:hypothetical protein
MQTLHVPPVARAAASFLRALRPVVVLGSLLFLSLGQAAPAKKSFDLPVGEASTTLRQFADQAGEQLLYTMATVQGVRSNAVKGEMTAREALARMLAGSELTLKQDRANGALSIVRVSDPNAPRGATSPPNADRLIAPEASSAPKPASVPGDVVELSPFAVSGDKDTGYAAKETLSGTRMRTSLKDVSAPLTTLTPELMKDLAINSHDQALLFTPSIDAENGNNITGQDANFMRFGAGQQYTIRGFTGDQSLSHDFFTALEPSDNYNVERTTLSLGPNALLIGVGNPQGSAETTTKRAQLNRRKTEVQLQVDRWGSSRAALDHNQPLLDDRLALRVNLLHDRKREFRDNEGRNQKRVTLGLSAKPSASTTITLNHESYDIDFNFASLTWGFDAPVVRWIAAGKPTVNFVPAGLTWSATRPYVDASGKRIPVAPGVVDADGYVDSQAGFDPKGVLAQVAAHQQRWLVGLPMANPVVNERYQAQITAATFGGSSHAFYMSMNPWAELGLKKDTYLAGGSWDFPSEQQNGRWTTVLVDQKIARNLYLEVGANLAKQNRELDPNVFNTISVDVNRYLPDGTPNPGYLVPFAQNANPQMRFYENRNEEYRAALSYEFQLTKSDRWMGRQNLVALRQYRRTELAQDLTRIVNVATVGRAGAGWTTDAVAVAHVMGTKVYFLNGNVPTMPDSHQLQQNMAAIEGYGQLVGATANERAPISLSRQSFLNVSKGKFYDNALSAGWQGRWLGDRLVTVAGVRKDTTESYGVPSVRNVVLPSIAGAATDPNKQFFAPKAVVPYTPRPSVATSGTSRTYGAVLHALPWLSLTYNQSANFLPVSDASWVNALGEPAPNTHGKTRDYGVRFPLLDGRLTMGLTRFKTSAVDQARFAGPYTLGARNVFTRLRTNYRDVGDSHFRDMPSSGYPVELGISDTWSYVAEGYELTTIFNPSRNWRMALTGSSHTNELGTHLQALGKYLYTDSKFQGLGTWRTFASELNKVAAGQASAQFDLNPANSAHRAQAAADALYLIQQATAQERTYLDDRAQEGVTTNRNGKYALNGLITRKFTEGSLRGWSLGGNFRWRSGGTVGYERLRDASGAPRGIVDVSKPITGKEYWDVGAMVSLERRLFRNLPVRVQLNVQNLFNWQEHRAVRMDYDTTGVYGAVDAIVPVLFELRRPRNFVLTTEFTF